MSQPSIIIGNGSSRKNLDLKKVINQITKLEDWKPKVFVCNHGYKDYYDFNYVVAVDYEIVSDIIKNNRAIYESHRLIIDNIIFNEKAGLNSGRIAMQCAMDYIKSDSIYLIAFDSLMTHTDIQRGSNMYYKESISEFSSNAFKSMFIDFVNLDDYKDKQIYLVEHDGFKYAKLSNNTIPFNIDHISDSSTILALHDLL